MKNTLRFCCMLLAISAFMGFSACSSSTTTTETTPTTTPTNDVAEKPADGHGDAPTNGDQNVVTGTFVGLEMGDYMHFNMKSDAGEELSFFVMDLSADQISPFEQPGMEGKKVEVTWQKVTRNIPEAGGEMEIEEVTNIKVIE